MGILMLNGNNYTGGVQQVYGTSSGAIATFADGGNNKPLNSLKVAITPQQAQGTPSPSNPLPISGWNGCNIKRTNKNVAPNANFTVQRGTVQTFDVNLPSGNYSISFGASRSGSDSRASSCRLIYEDNTNYEFSFTPSGTVKKENITAAKPIKSLYMYSIEGSYADSGNFTLTITNFQMEIGSSATSYEPYNGTTYPITWSDAGTVYGGYINIRCINGVWSGEVVKDKAFVSFDGTESWSAYATYSYHYQINVSPNNKKQTLSVSSHFMGDTEMASNSPSTDNLVFSADGNRLRFKRQACADLQEWKAFVADQYTNGTPIQVVYYLDIPNTYPIAPENIPNILTLLGNNNIWSDTGDITECVYQRDLNLAFNELWDLVHSNSGTRSLSASNLTKSASIELKEETTEETKEEEQNEDKR